MSRILTRVFAGWNRLLGSPHIVFALLASFFGIISAIIVPQVHLPGTNNEGVPDEFIHWTNANIGLKHIFKMPLYWPQFIGVRVSEFFTHNTWVNWEAGRFVNLLVYVIAVFFIIKYLKHLQWVFVFIALTPMMIQQAGSLSYDVINFIGVTFFLMVIINLIGQKDTITRKQLFVLILSAILLYFSKVTDLILLLLIFALPKELFINSKPYLFIRAKISKLWLIIISVTLILIAFIYGLTKYVLLLLSLNPVGWKQTFLAFFNTFFYGTANPNLDISQTKGLIGAFGSLTYSLPTWIVIFAFLVLLTVIFAYSYLTISKRFVVLSTVVFILSVIVIDFGMYFSFGISENGIIDFMNGSQGRYFTPLIPLLAPLVIFLSQKLDIGSTKNSEVVQKNVVLLVILSSLFLLTTYICLTIQYWSVQ